MPSRPKPLRRLPRTRRSWHVLQQTGCESVPASYGARRFSSRFTSPITISATSIMRVTPAMRAGPGEPASRADHSRIAFGDHWNHCVTDAKWWAADRGSGVGGDRFNVMSAVQFPVLLLGHNPNRRPCHRGTPEVHTRGDPSLLGKVSDFDFDHIPDFEGILTLLERWETLNNNLRIGPRADENRSVAKPPWGKGTKHPIIRQIRDPYEVRTSVEGLAHGKVRPFDHNFLPCLGADWSHRCNLRTARNGASPRRLALVPWCFDLFGRLWTPKLGFRCF